MELKKITLGKRVKYQTTRGVSGAGKVEDIKTSNNGAWIVVHDKTRNKTLTLRPGSLSA